MRIYVNQLGVKKISLDIEPSTRIEDLKILIKKEIDIDEYNQRLFFNNKQLLDNQTLDYYNVIEESTLFVISKMTLCGGSCATFKDLDGKEIKIEGFCPGCMTGISFKYKIIEEIPSYKIKYLHIFYNKKEIEDDKSFQEQFIYDNAFIDIQYKAEFEIKFVLSESQKEKIVKVKSGDKVAKILKRIQKDHEFMGDLKIINCICNNKNINVNKTFEENEIKVKDTIVIECQRIIISEKTKKCIIF